jgi:hypothetical protein
MPVTSAATATEEAPILNGSRELRDVMVSTAAVTARNAVRIMSI